MTSVIDTKLKRLIQFLTKHEQSISVAESCTGGYLSYLLTKIPGSSHVFNGGFVTYTNISKSKNLKISEKDIENVGAVSPEMAILMSQKVREVTGSTYGISITGNAGPGITEKSSRVGELYIGITTPKDTFCFSLQIEGTRNQVRKIGAEKAIELLSTELGLTKS
jgi:PncC family amidohydrolase